MSEDKPADTEQDRGFLYGDALFETFLVEGGRAWFLERHIARFRASAEFFGYEPERAREAIALMRACEARRDGLWRVTLSRGGHAPFGGVGSSGARWRAPLGSLSPASLVSLPGTYFPGDRIAEHKTSNYLRQIEARRAALRLGVDDAIMISRCGVVGEASAANVVLDLDGELVTPVVDGLLPGVTRGVLVDAGVVRATRVSVGALERCAGVYLISSGVLVRAASDIDGRALDVSRAAALLDVLWAAREEES